MIPHPALPTNPSLWSLTRILDQARRWLDHCDNQEDFNEIESFITELEVRICQINEQTDYLNRCLSHEQQQH